MATVLSNSDLKKLGINVTKAGKKNKYGAVGVWCCPVCWTKCGKESTWCDHKDKPVYFDSRGEYKYWIHLLQMDKLGVIKNLDRQVPYNIDINDNHVGKYVADFVYEEVESGRKAVIDFKGFDTSLSRFKRKTVEALYGIKITVICDIK